MRIERLDLTAFGPFSGLELDLGAPGVHVVHGPNEAGKSSALAALRALLYGIPVQTPFDFVHAKPHLKLGARLSNDAGETLEVIRLKRRQNTLTAVDGSPIPEGHLLGFLHGLPEETFATTFALTLDELQRGGASLLKGEGDIGQALYSAQSSQDLSAVLEALEARQKELYLPGGSNPPLNQALKQYKELTDQIEELATATGEFVRLRTEVEAAEKEFSELERQLKDARAQYRRWEGLRTALPLLRTRQQASRELAALADEGPLAAPDADERLRALEETATTGRVQRELAEHDLASHQEELSALHVDERLASAQAEITALVRSMEAIDATSRSLDGLVQDADKHRREAGELLRRVRPDTSTTDTGAFRITAAVREQITALAAQHPDLAARMDNARTHTGIKAADAEKARADLAELPTAEGRDVLDTVVAQFPPKLVEDLDRAHGDLSATTARLDSLVAEAGWGAQAREALLTATVPARAEVSAHRDRLTHHEAELKTQHEEHARTRKARDKAVGDLEALRSRVDPPSLDDLYQARDRRDELWGPIRRQESTSARLADFEAALRTADQLADRLRNDAEDVATRLTLEAKVRDLEQDLRNRGEDFDALVLGRTDLDRDWVALWPGEEVPAPSLDAAETVLDRIRELHDLHEQHQAQHRTLARLEESAQTLLDQLLDLLGGAGVPVESIAAQAGSGGGSARAVALLPQLTALAEKELEDRKKTVEEHTTARLRVEATDQDLERAHQDLAEAEKALDAWARRWDTAIAPAGFARATAPEAVQADLGRLADVADLLDRAHHAEQEVERARGEVADFDERLSLVFQACGAQMPEGRAARASALEELDRRVAENTEVSRHREDLVRIIASDEDELQQARSLEKSTGEALAALWAETGVSDTIGLRAAITRAGEASSQRKRLDETEQHLMRQGDIAALEEQAQDLSDVEASEHVDRADRHLEDVGRRRDEASTRLTRARGELDRVDGSARAAQVAEERAALAAQIAEQAEEYVRLTLARQILLARVETYRRQNQDPILRRAEEIFRTLTLGRFTELRPDLDKKGNNVLRVLRENGALEEIGALSEGTRDQLYLALRLASLERYADVGQAMPFVVDDVFMTFDDERTAAALNVLDTMAERFQVVVFTHHDHLAHLAERALPEGRSRRHPLPRFAPPPASAAGQPTLITAAEGTSLTGAGKPQTLAPGERICRDCGNSFIHTKRGRPPVQCPPCRAQSS